jgi:hypothetical protein
VTKPVDASSHHPQPAFTSVRQYNRQQQELDGDNGVSPFCRLTTTTRNTPCLLETAPRGSIPTIPPPAPSANKLAASHGAIREP